MTYQTKWQTFCWEKKCSKTDYLFVDETGFDDKRKWVSVKMFDKVENPECRSASKILTRANFSSSKNKVQEVILSIQEKSELQTSQNTVGIWYTDVSWSHRGWAANGLDFKWLPNYLKFVQMDTFLSRSNCNPESNIGISSRWFINGHECSFSYNLICNIAEITDWPEIQQQIFKLLRSVLWRLG